MEGWFDRLKEEVESATDADGKPRSLRDLSREMEAGVNYVQQMLRDRKDPGAERLVKLLNVLGQESAIYVITGRRTGVEFQEFHAIVSQIPERLRPGALDILRSIRKTSGDQEQ